MIYSFYGGPADGEEMFIEEPSPSEILLTIVDKLSEDDEEMVANIARTTYGEHNYRRAGHFYISQDVKLRESG